MTIDPKLLETVRKTARAAREAKSPAWRSEGLHLADAALRATRPGASAADRQGYLYALAVFAGLAVGEMQKLQGAPAAQSSEDAA